MTDRRLLAVLSVLAVPWSVQTFTGGHAPAFVFAWGLVDIAPLSVTFLWDFLALTAGLPAYIQAWPLSVACYLAALGSVVAGRWDREDPRVTAGLLAAAGVAQVTLAQGFSVQPGRTAWSLGALVCWVVAWWVYDTAR